MNTCSSHELSALQDVDTLVCVPYADRQLAYQKLDEVFGGLGENLSISGVHDTIILAICRAKTQKEVREIWGQYVVQENQQRFHREVQEATGEDRYIETRPWERYAGM